MGEGVEVVGSGTTNISSEELRAFSELRSCVEVEVEVLGSPSLIDLIVSVDVKQHCTNHSCLLAKPFLAERHTEKKSSPHFFVMFWGYTVVQQATFIFSVSVNIPVVEPINNPT